MKLSVKVATTSKTVNIFMQDSSSTTGAGLTGLVFNSSGLTAYYALPRAAAVSITLATQTVTGAYSSGGFVEISSANMPGWYRFDIPDAAIASGAFTSIHFKGATNLAPLPIEIELTGWDNQDAVHGGMSALPNVASGSAGAIPTTGTGSNQISVSSGQVILQTGTGTGQLDFTSGVVKANLAQILGTALTETAGLIAAGFKQFFNTASPTSTMNTITTVTTATNLTNAPTAGDLTAAMKTSVTTACTASTPTAAAVTGAVGSVTGAVGSVTGNVGGNVVGSVGSLTTNNDKTGYAVAVGGIPSGGIVSAEKNNLADACLDRRLDVGTDSSADTTTGRTWRSALRQLRNKASISAGTMTVCKEDDTTTSHTATVATTAGNPISSIDPA